MNQSLKKGLGFGLTSAIVTTLGTIIGIWAGTGSARLILISVYTVALADSLSDALGLHNVEESQKQKDVDIWKTTVFTFLFKFIFAISFAIAFYFVNVETALYIDIVWGVLLLIIFSVYLAKQRKVSIFATVSEHLFLATIVILCTYFLGNYLDKNI